MFRDFKEEFPIIVIVNIIVYLLAFPLDPATALETFLKFTAFVCVGYFILKYIVERWFL